MNEVHITIGKMFAKSGCLTQEVIMQYVNGSLNKAESRLVELHVADCEFCSDALDGITEVGTQVYAATVQDVGDAVDERVRSGQKEDSKVIEFRPNINPPQAATVAATTTSRFTFKKVLPLFGIAASIALILTFGIFYMGDSASKIADRNFEALSNTTRSVRAPESPDEAPANPSNAAASQDAFNNGLSHYESKDFKAAAALFDQSKNSQASLFAGDCYYQLGEFKQAAARYQSTIDAKQGHEQHAEFNLAMTFLKMEEIDNAKSLLEKMAQNKDHNFSQKANDALKDLAGL